MEDTYLGIRRCTFLGQHQEYDGGLVPPEFISYFFFSFSAYKLERTRGFGAVFLEFGGCVWKAFRASEPTVDGKCYIMWVLKSGGTMCEHVWAIASLFPLWRVVKTVS
jgi:hypothetical protein